jgi:ribonucleoside-triphosphate reductase
MNRDQEEESMYVIKRDGRREIFDQEKIFQAVEKAFIATIRPM